MNSNNDISTSSTSSSDSTSVIAETINDIKIEPYTSKTGSTKSFKVSGEKTRDFKDGLKSIGGKWNSRLAGGAGWIFPNNKHQAVKELLTTGALGQMTVSDYQTVHYKLIRPRVGMNVQIVDNSGKITKGTIIEAKPGYNNTITRAKVQITEGDLFGIISTPGDKIESLFIIDGKWKLMNHDFSYNVTFITSPPGSPKN